MGCLNSDLLDCISHSNKLPPAVQVYFFASTAPVFTAASVFKTASWRASRSIPGATKRPCSWHLVETPNPRLSLKNKARPRSLSESATLQAQQRWVHMTVFPSAYPTLPKPTWIQPKGTGFITHRFISWIFSNLLTGIPREAQGSSITEFAKNQHQMPQHLHRNYYPCIAFRNGDCLKILNLQTLSMPLEMKWSDHPPVACWGNNSDDESLLTHDLGTESTEETEASRICRSPLLIWTGQEDRRRQKWAWRNCANGLSLVLAKCAPVLSLPSTRFISTAPWPQPKQIPFISLFLLMDFSQGTLHESEKKKKKSVFNSS